MDTALEILKIGGAAVVSMGGGTVVLLALSSWLGKVWASRILQDEKNELQKELERHKSDLQIDQNKFKEEFRRDSEKAIHLHKVQFETEFKAYQEIWLTLSEALTAVNSIWPHSQRNNDIPPSPAWRRSLINPCMTELDKARVALGKNAPFIIHEVLTSISELLVLIRELAFTLDPEVEHHSRFVDVRSNDELDWQKVSEALQEASERSQTIAKKISKRIGLIVVVDER